MPEPTAPSAEPSPPPEVRDRASRPAGLIPRHLQTWVMAGLAALIVGVILFTGPGPTRSTPAAPRPPVTVDASQARIQEYRDRLEEEVRRLRAEQSDLAAAKRSLSGTASSAAEPPTAAPAESTEGDGATARAAIAQDQAQRAYRALYADNLAWSSRAREQPSTSRTDVALVDAAPPGHLPVALGVGRPASSPTPGSPEAPAGSPAGASPSQGSSQPAPPSPPSKALNPAPASGGSTYTVVEGTCIEAVLTNRLDGSTAGPVNGMVTTPVYARDFQHVLIPRGSRVLGTSSPVSQFGQSRLAVVFHRLIFPDGRSISLDRLPALNERGDTGLRDRVDQHLLQVFGTSLAIGALAGLAQVNTAVGLEESWTDAYRQGVGSSVTQSSMRILDRFLNQLPTVTIREGHRVKVYLTSDLVLPAYAEASPEADVREPLPSPNGGQEGRR